MAIDTNHAASIDMAGYERAATSGSVEVMALFIRRVVQSRGGRVSDEAALRDVARLHCGRAAGSGGAVVVLSYKHLLWEIDTCAWCARVERGPATAAAADSGGRAAGDAAAGGCGSCGGHAQSSSSSCAAALGADSLGHGGGQPAELSPSAPPAPPGAEAPEAASVEVQLDRGELGAAPTHDRGALAVYQPSWGLSYLLFRRPYVLVLRHPTDPTRGARLYETADHDEIMRAAEVIRDKLGLAGTGLVDHQIYTAVCNDPELRAAVLAGCAHTAAAASASSSSSNGAAAATAPAAAAAAAAAAGPSAGDCGDCPICFGPIEASSAAMRCTGEGGRHHYFHSACMRQWIGQCRSGAGATCPVCRGHIQFHAQRLEQFLAGAESAGLAQEDRTFLQQCADHLRNVAGADWGEVFTMENAKRWGGLAAAGGWGFMLGYTQPPLTLQHQLTLDLLPREHRVAQGIGWLLGALVRILRDLRREREERERDRERERQHRGGGSRRY